MSTEGGAGDGGKGNNNNRRNRGRGGRGGRGRSRRGKGKDGEETDSTLIEPTKEKANAKEKTTSNDHSRDTSHAEWLKGVLRNLGHFDPTSVNLAADVEDPEVADNQLVSLTLWLEDRIIRCWDLDRREKLRNDYWNQINYYLDDLECPGNFFPGEYYADEKKEKPHWRYSASHRIRVVNWLTSCATSEAFSDIPDQQTEPHVKEEAVRKEEERNEGERPQSTSVVSATEDLSVFPLGFATGDAEVDHVLTALRMKLLIQLEEDQKAVNAAISEIQSITAEKAKPLKQAKLRPHNVSKPPPPKKSNKNQPRGRRR